MKIIKQNTEYSKAFTMYIEGRRVVSIEYQKTEIRDRLDAPEGYVITYSNGYKQYFLGGSSSGMGWTMTSIYNERGEFVASDDINE